MLNLNSIESKFIINWLLFVVSLQQIYCFNKEYKLGYNDGYNDAIGNLKNKFDNQVGNGHHLKLYQSDYELPYKGPNFDDYETEQPTDKPNVENYAKMFGVDEKEFTERMSKLDAVCREKIRPHLGPCIERATNTYKLNTQLEKLGENECKALWDLMCCFSEIVTTECKDVDQKLMKTGFNAIQNVIEQKDCKKVKRGTVNCKSLTTDTMAIKFYNV
ncbi:uncharacterized protein LOC128956291 [Oppia nitens]|uniref:uncharacterized protein LOC128956291 n=1 Tax=Oppia nitens TaxID=1686743 RepID=UPI0023DBEF4B|nr:uncharacterized protein LOC128956291 [Oppia nitens]